MKTKTHLFDEFQSKEDIIKYGRKKSKILITSMMTAAASAGLIPVAFADVSIVISIIGKSIIQIGKYYGYVWEKISKNDLKAIYNGKLYSPEIENDNDNSEFNRTKEILKIFGEMLLKSIGTAFALSLDDIIKSVWGLGTIAGVAFGALADAGIVYNYLNKAKNYFESKCQADDGTIFFTTRCIEYEIIFRAFKQFEVYELIYSNQ